MIPKVAAKKTSFIEHVTNVQLQCKERKPESVEYYQVLALFSKHYNKWFVASETKIKWDTNAKPKKYCILSE